MTSSPFTLGTEQLQALGKLCSRRQPYQPSTTAIHPRKADSSQGRDPLFRESLFAETPPRLMSLFTHITFLGTEVLQLPNHVEWPQGTQHPCQASPSSEPEAYTFCDCSGLALFLGFQTLSTPPPTCSWPDLSSPGGGRVSKKCQILLDACGKHWVGGDSADIEPQPQGTQNGTLGSGVGEQESLTGEKWVFLLGGPHPMMLRG